MHVRRCIERRREHSALSLSKPSKRVVCVARFSLYTIAKGSNLRNAREWQDIVEDLDISVLRCPRQALRQRQLESTLEQRHVFKSNRRAWQCRNTPEDPVVHRRNLGAAQRQCALHRARHRHLGAAALSSERKPLPDRDEIAAERGVILLPERGGKFVRIPGILV